MFKKDDLVTVQLEEPNKASNTYIVYGELGEEVVLFHPIHPKCFLVKHNSELNKVQATLKDSTERSMDFCLRFQDYLDHNTKGELEAISLYFIVHRTLTNRQKNNLAHICGTIASIYFHNDISLAIRQIVENTAVLDSFNSMWVVNFKDLFSGKKPIVSPKQRASIFNIAGFVLAELASQVTKK